MFYGNNKKLSKTLKFKFSDYKKGVTDTVKMVRNKSNLI